MQIENLPYLRPSSAERILECPASHYLSEGLPAVPPSPAASRGTAMHRIFEQLLKSKLKKEPLPADIDLTTEDSLIVLDAIKTMFDPKQFGDEPPKKNDILFAESELFLQDETFPLRGTLDFLLVYKKDKQIFVKIYDLKTGRGHVESDESVQLRLYAGLALTWLKGFHPLASVASVTITILQEGNTNVTSFSPGDILLAYELCRETYQSSIVKIDSAPNPGSWCHFCPAKVRCPALTPVLDIATKGAPENLSDEQLEAILRKGALVKKMIDEAEAYAYILKKRDPARLTNFQIVEKESRLKITKENELVELLGEEAYRLEKKLRTQADLVKMLKQKKGPNINEFGVRERVEKLVLKTDEINFESVDDGN